MRIPLQDHDILRPFLQPALLDSQPLQLPHRGSSSQHNRLWMDILLPSEGDLRGKKCKIWTLTGPSEKGTLLWLRIVCPDLRLRKQHAYPKPGIQNESPINVCFGTEEGISA